MTLGKGARLDAGDLTELRDLLRTLDGTGAEFTGTVVLREHGFSAAITTGDSEVSTVTGVEAL